MDEINIRALDTSQKSTIKVLSTQNVYTKLGQEMWENKTQFLFWLDHCPPDTKT